MLLSTDVWLDLLQQRRDINGIKLTPFYEFVQNSLPGNKNNDHLTYLMNVIFRFGKVCLGQMQSITFS